ncbi:MAG: hypothetical protein IJS88_00250 [Alphaproteobacteria bacterium]|nr:hypothetical protein [Alphaproteobacteria bacterium]
MKIFYFLCMALLVVFPAYAEDSVVVGDTESTTKAVETSVEHAVDADDAEIEKIEVSENETSTMENGDNFNNREDAENPETDNTGKSAEAKTDLLDITASDNHHTQKNTAIEKLPDVFAANLRLCTPDEVSHEVNGSIESIKIVGMDNDKCKVRIALFVLNIPIEKLADIDTYNDFEALCHDENIAILEYKENYRFSNLMSELSLCSKYSSLHHNGRSSSKYESINASIVTDMMTQYKDGECVVTFVNEITLGNKFMDYSVQCSVQDSERERILEPYADLIDLYGAKEIVHKDGSVSARTAITNNETYKADAKLLYELQKNGLCHLVHE